MSHCVFPGSVAFRYFMMVLLTGSAIFPASGWAQIKNAPAKSNVTSAETVAEEKPVKVVVESKNGSFQLLRNGQPYFIKGAVGRDYLEKLEQYGGNAIRADGKKETLDKALGFHLTVLVNLPVKAERDGMDYNDSAAVKKQQDEIIEIVSRIKNHPAILMWALGNELDEGLPHEQYNHKVWDAVNALAVEIHRIDPNHPVMTVVGSLSKGKIINELNKSCPALDVLGINEYGNLLKVPGWLRKFGWQKPYAVTEWGPTGFWQVPNTAWKAPVEETSSMKADKYKERYEQVILKDKSYCLGSYVFLWRQHQERTHTWFGMFDANGLETEAVGVMQYEWTGKWPENKAPELDSAKIDGQTAYHSIYLKPDQTCSAEVWVKDPDKDSVTYRWEILKEGDHFPYGGNGEKRPPAVPDLFSATNTRQVSFRSPPEEGAYRLFIYAYDGHQHWATANIPFYVKKD